MVDWDDESLTPRRAETPRSGGLRHDVRIPAQIESVRDGVIDAEVVDLSSGGMYLRHAMLIDSGDQDTLPLGGAVTVTFAPGDASAPNAMVRIPAEIMRRNPHGIGVRFVDVTREQRHALRTLALQAVEARARAGSGARSGARAAKHDGRLIMSLCLKVLERRIPNLVWSLRNELVRRLRSMDSKDLEGSSATPKADADLIEEKGTAIARTIERRVIRTFAEVGGLDDTQQLVLSQVKRQLAKAKAGRTDDKMTLLKDESLASSVAMEATCQRLETELAGRSFDVNVRLANVLGRRIDQIENPLVPAVMCRMLWQSVTYYCESSSVRNCLHSTIVKYVMPLISDIYDDIDETLDAQGVPNSYYTAKGPGGMEKPPNRPGKKSP